MSLHADYHPPFHLTSTSASLLLLGTDFHSDSHSDSHSNFNSHSHYRLSLRSQFLILILILILLRFRSIGATAFYYLDHAGLPGHGRHCFDYHSDSQFESEFELGTTLGAILILIPTPIRILVLVPTQIDSHPAGQQSEALSRVK